MFCLNPIANISYKLTIERLRLYSFAKVCKSPLAQDDQVTTDRYRSTCGLLFIYDWIIRTCRALFNEPWLAR